MRLRIFFLNLLTTIAYAMEEAPITQDLNILLKQKIYTGEELQRLYPWNIQTNMYDDKTSKISLFYKDILCAEKYGNIDLQTFRVLGPTVNQHIIIDDKEIPLCTESSYLFTLYQRLPDNKNEHIQAIHPQQELYASANDHQGIFIYDRSQNTKFCVQNPTNIAVSQLPEIIFLNHTNIAIVHKDQIPSKLDIIQFPDKMNDRLSDQNIQHETYQFPEKIFYSGDDQPNAQELTDMLMKDQDTTSEHNTFYVYVTNIESVPEYPHIILTELALKKSAPMLFKSQFMYYHALYHIYTKQLHVLDTMNDNHIIKAHPQTHIYKPCIYQTMPEKEEKKERMLYLLHLIKRKTH